MSTRKFFARKTHIWVKKSGTLHWVQSTSVTKDSYKDPHKAQFLEPYLRSSCTFVQPCLTQNGLLWSLRSGSSSWAHHLVAPRSTWSMMWYDVMIYTTDLDSTDQSGSSVKQLKKNLTWIWEIGLWRIWNT